MKQKTQWIAALAMVASASIAMGCGCSTTTVRRIEPVREIIVQRPSTCLMETQRPLDWGAPFRTVGHVISAPFVAIGSAFTPSDRYVEPIGERLTYTPTYRYGWTNESMLMPVGERFTTVKIIRHKTVMLPVGERFIIKKHYYKTSLKPVGERFLIVKHHKTMLKPVGEQTVIRTKSTGKYSKSW